MDHQKYIEYIKLSVYGELDAASQAELQNHLVECADCREEFETQIKLKSVLSRQSLPEPDEKMLFEARSGLREAIRKERKKQPFGLAIKEMLSFIFNPALKYGLTTFIVLGIGFLLGYGVFYNPTNSSVDIVADKGQATEEISFIQDDVRIDNVRFIDQDASDGEVEFTFEAVKPVRMKGRIEDSNIQKVLMYAILNVENPGVRLNSINAMQSKQPQNLDNDVKAAVISVVKYDENPGVRKQALELLKEFPYDESKKQALLFVLINDTSAAMRIEAINALVEAQKEGAKFRKEDLSVFKEKFAKDENNYVRFTAQTVLKEN